MEISKEIPNLIHRVTARKMARHTCRLFIKDEKGKPAPKGSGILFMVKGVHFLLTASHITQNWSDDNHIYIKTGNNNFIALVGGLRETDFYKGKHVDLSYVKIAESIVSELQKSYVFLPYSKISENKDLTKNVIYSIIGYPEITKEGTEEDFTSEAQAYFLQPCSQTMYGMHNLDPETYYLLKIKSNEKDSVMENTKIIAALSKVNGSGLWLMTSEGSMEVSVDYKLIGIITKFGDSAHSTFIAMRLCLIIDMIRKLEKIEMQEPIES
jgi:hypothetical protein